MIEVALASDADRWEIQIRQFDFKQLRDASEHVARQGGVHKYKHIILRFLKKKYVSMKKSETLINNIYFYIRNRLIINRSVYKE